MSCEHPTERGLGVGTREDINEQYISAQRAAKTKRRSYQKEHSGLTMQGPVRRRIAEPQKARQFEVACPTNY